MKLKKNSFPQLSLSLISLSTMHEAVGETVLLNNFSKTAHEVVFKKTASLVKRAGPNRTLIVNMQAFSREICS